MVNFREQQDKFDKLISELNSDIVCGLAIGTIIQDSSLYLKDCQWGLGGPVELNDTKKYKIGTFNNKNVIIDPYRVWDDLRVFNESGTELIDLSNFGFDDMDMI